MIREWVSNLFIVIVSLTFIEILLPDSSVSKYLRFIFSLVIMATVIYPLVDLISNIK
ncbi:MAG: stage III sporulation protein AF [Anaerovoracaceae bacterium]